MGPSSRERRHRARQWSITMSRKGENGFDTENAEFTEKTRELYESSRDIWNDHDCGHAGCSCDCAGAGNADAQAGAAAASDANGCGEAGISADGTVAGRREGPTGYAGTSREDRWRIESYTAASRGGDSRGQGAAATVGALPESDGGLHG